MASSDHALALGALSTLKAETNKAALRAMRGDGISEETVGKIVMCAMALAEGCGYDTRTCMSLAAIDMGLPMDSEFDRMMGVKE